MILTDSGFQRSKIIRIWNAVRATETPDWGLKVLVSRIVYRMPAFVFCPVSGIPLNLKVVFWLCTLLKLCELLFYCIMAWIFFYQPISSKIYRIFYEALQFVNLMNFVSVVPPFLEILYEAFFRCTKFLQ